MLPFAMKNIRLFLIVCALSIIPTLAVWAPFYLRLPEVWNIPLPTEGMQTVVANYDGPLYIAVARSLYSQEIIENTFSFSLPYEYYAAHLPLFPLLIRAFSYGLGYSWGMLIATVLTSVFAHWYFFRFIKLYTKRDDHALWLTLIFAILPARWLIARSVGAPEPLFVGAIIACMFHFKKKEYIGAGIFGAIATLTKSPGILLFPSLFMTLFLPRFEELATTHDFKKWVKTIHVTSVFLFLIPLALLAIFIWYAQPTTFSNFFAYFNSGNNIHLFFPPFQIFDYSQPWVGTHWLEEIIFVYMIGALAVARLVRERDWSLVWFVGVFFATTLFISHRDMVRYSLPIVPFIITAFRKELTSVEFRFVLAILVIPIFLFSLVFIVNNQTPISDWTPFL